MKPLCVFILLLFIIISCNKEDDFGFPIVHTGEVTHVTSEKAVFNGRILVNDKTLILSHGFVWSTSNSPTLSRSNVISLGTLNDKDFKSKVSDNLVPNRRYYVRAFAIDSKSTVYGREVIFITKREDSLNNYDF